MNDKATFYAQFEQANTHHSHWRQQRLREGGYSWSTSSVLLTLVTVLATLFYAGILQPYLDKSLNTAFVLAMRTSAWMGRISGGSNMDGGALKTVFGLDSGSLRSLGTGSATMRGLGNMLLKNTTSLIPPGLGNMSNSCYQNSIIQGLASLPSLPNFLARVKAQQDAAKSTNSALLETLHNLNDPESNGRHFWLPDKLKSMSTWQQQDAQEYYSKILDQLDREAEQSLRIVESVKYGLKEGAHTAEDVKSAALAEALRNPLEGMLAQRVGCTNCGYSEGLSLIPFNCLTVPLGNQYLYDARDCLDEYTKLEQIEGVECPKCTLLRAQKSLAGMSAKQLPEEILHSVQDRLRIVEEALQDEEFSDNTIIKKCQVPKKQWVSSTKSKQAIIARPPKSLAIHFNRSLFNEITGAQTKNNADVQFALGLDLDSWCLGTTENWSMDPTRSMLPAEDVEDDVSSNKYELRAVVTHSGRHENGHYVCYRKRLHPGDIPISEETEEDLVSKEEESKTKEAWWRLSDEDVHIVTEDTVLRQGNVFMLFYEKIKTATAIPAELSSSAGAAEASTAVDTFVDASETQQSDYNSPDYGNIDEFSELVDDLNITPETELAVAYPNLPQPSFEESDRSVTVDSSEADDSSITSFTDELDTIQSSTGILVPPNITPNQRIMMRTSGLGSSSSPEDPLKSPGARMLTI
ncbi:cysteine proteinase [Tothia fuscella]|uniref:ubiquitinyl hydrolase 1 n=1 Tax=Tothia fuscella TaxID=1048955 RepID=A0A9P4TW18_9PEZI|nr:cysteine proteinase [Tothia fuscella]